MWIGLCIYKVGKRMTPKERVGVVFYRAMESVKDLDVYDIMVVVVSGSGQSAVGTT